MLDGESESSGSLHAALRAGRLEIIEPRTVKRLLKLSHLRSTTSYKQVG